jgi:A/G-specific adenine glycosylase
VRTFAESLLAWFDQHGRHDLPWQQPRTPYRVWLSEIMLQQTQVASVKAYFTRFIDRFDNVHKLAAAPADEVMALWAGLGYYTRARNLHACAKLIVDRFDGQFPNNVKDLAALPGIGQSTAAAIVSQAFDLPAAILDGNVKRVLARQVALDQVITSPAAQKQLQAIADQRLPSSRFADYTQAQMDLGALICKPKQPQCLQCPVQTICAALQTQQVSIYPIKKPRKTVPHRHCAWLIARDSVGRVLLQRRPDHGIWGGMYALPQAESYANFLVMNLPIAKFSASKELPEIKHQFTHFTLWATPHAVSAVQMPGVSEPTMVWADATQLKKLALPAPIRALLIGLL